MQQDQSQRGVVVRHSVRLALIIIVEVGLLLYVWITHHPTPAEPHGKMEGIVLTFLVLALPFLLMGAFKRKPPEENPPT
jgi:hypothetical protein